MKSLVTQFDDRKFATAVATPTCGGCCCCCCCCLATTLTASSLLAQRINKEAMKHGLPNRRLLTVIAALFVPITGLLSYASFWVMSLILNNCYQNNLATYSNCTEPGGYAGIIIQILLPFLFLWFLYKKVYMENPAKRALLVTALIAVAFTMEFVAGAFIVLAGFGIGYLIVVPFIIGFLSRWYYRHLGKDIARNTAGPSASAAPIPLAPPANPVTENTSENEEEPSQPIEPTQPTPPAPGTE